jgi:hypothetical protein
LEGQETKTFTTHLKMFTSTTDIPLNKLYSITTNGAPSMIGSTDGLTALCQKTNHISLSYTLEVLCAKVPSFKHVQDSDQNFITAAPLQRRHFKQLLGGCQNRVLRYIMHGRKVAQ